MVPFTTNLVPSHGNLSLAATLYAANLLLLGAALWLHIRRMRAQPALATAELTAALGRGMERRIGLFRGVALVALGGPDRTQLGDQDFPAAAGGALPAAPAR